MNLHEDIAWRRQHLTSLCEQHRNLVRFFNEDGGYLPYMRTAFAFAVAAVSAWYGIQHHMWALSVQVLFCVVWGFNTLDASHAVWKNREYLRKCEIDIANARKEKQIIDNRGIQHVFTVLGTPQSAWTPDMCEIVREMRITIKQSGWMGG